MLQQYLNQEVANRKFRAIEIDIEDLFSVSSAYAFCCQGLNYDYCLCERLVNFLIPHMQYTEMNEESRNRVEVNTRVLNWYGIDELMPEPTETDHDHDILMTQRSDDGPENMDGSDPHQKMPPEVKRYFYELIGDEEEQVARLAEDGNIYEKPDIKKALLLLLVGAPHRKLNDGMKLSSQRNQVPPYSIMYVVKLNFAYHYENSAFIRYGYHLDVSSIVK
ncbi:hypothetical protein DVH24_027300 [Malus domestica]|uniref:Uncharacterized protein n=1 Tax=Malus domestica TaxID=3750 RepID=A0A498ISH2_MALDO|nr:hypothetical protein DVH24_027300 [Malus domestica]